MSVARMQCNGIRGLCLAPSATPHATMPQVEFKPTSEANLWRKSQ